MPRRKPTRWLEAARTAGRDRPRVERPDWLSRALARSGVMPLAEAEAAIRAGRIEINGRTAPNPFALVRKSDRIWVDGRPVELHNRTLALAFHKPGGVVTSTIDPEGQGTVFERLAAVLPPELRSYGWHAVGRLDRNTTGLLLFTNDERLVAHATAPATHLSKRYLAHVQGVPQEAQLAPLRVGLVLDDGPTRPALAAIRAAGVVELTLTEGRNHQVKRMLQAIGFPVTQLHREAVGGVELDTAVGTARLLTEVELRAGLGFHPTPA